MAEGDVSLLAGGNYNNLVSILYLVLMQVKFKEDTHNGFKNYLTQALLGTTQN
jgi:hypothetical protein